MCIYIYTKQNKAEFDDRCLHTVRALDLYSANHKDNSLIFMVLIPYIDRRGLYAKGNHLSLSTLGWSAKSNIQFTFVLLLQYSSFASIYEEVAVFIAGLRNSIKWPSQWLIYSYLVIKASSTTGAQGTINSIPNTNSFPSNTNWISHGSTAVS